MAEVATFTAIAARIIRHGVNDWGVPARDKGRYESPDLAVVNMYGDPDLETGANGWIGLPVPESERCSGKSGGGVREWMLEPPFDAVGTDGKSHESMKFSRVRRFPTMPRPCLVLGAVRRHEGYREQGGSGNYGEGTGGWHNDQRMIDLTVVAVFAHPWLALVWPGDLILSESEGP